MISKNVIKKVSATIMSLAMVVTSVVLNGTILKADDGVNTKKLVAFEYDGTNAVPGEDLVEYADSQNDYYYPATTGNGVMAASITGENLKHMEWGDSESYGIAVPILAASTKNPWSAKAYVEYTFSTEEYSGLKASIVVGGTKKGPQNLVIGYYEGNVFQTITNYTMNENKVLYTVTFDLPEVMDHQKNVSVYVKLADTINIGGNDMTDSSYNTGGELAINDFVVTYENKIESTTEEMTTVAERETTTAKNEAITSATTVALTTEVPTTSVITTSVPVTKESKTQVSVGKTKVKKISKKKESKKAKISLKKIKGAKYQVKISTTKKFMKDTTLNKKVKKAEFTVSSRKMKGKSVLYVKARAYKVVDGKIYYGKWSKVKVKK